MSQSVFVLEDDPDISRLVQHHLEAAGFAVRIFSTPANLIPDAERQAPALFLLDIMVPGGDGLDVYRRLRSHPGLSTVPIIFLTARAGENDRVLGLELGADDYITKPFATRELVARVKAVLRRFERPTAPSIISFEEVVIDGGHVHVVLVLTDPSCVHFLGMRRYIVDVLTALAGVDTVDVSMSTTQLWTSDRVRAPAVGG